MLQPENDESNNSINIVSIKQEVEDEIEANGAIDKIENPVMSVELKFEEDSIDYENSGEDPENNEIPVTTMDIKSQEDDSDPEWGFDEATTSGTGRSPHEKQIKKKSVEKRDIMERKRSNVWYHFSTVGDDIARCRYCRKKLSIKGGATGNLSRHLRMLHPKIPLSIRSSHWNNFSRNISDSVEEKIVTSLFEIQEGNVDDPANCAVMNTAVASASVMDIFKPNSKIIDEQLLKMIVKEYHHFSIVEDDEFKKLIYLLCPNYKLPSKKTLVHSILPMVYEATAVKVKDKLTHASAFCLTTDAWTSTNNVNFLEVTVHFLDDQLQLCSYMLGCFDFSESDTTKNLSSKIINICKKWDIENKIEAAITGRTIIAAAIRECGIKRIPCFAHNINLFVQSLLKHISPTVDTVQIIVDYFEQSPVALKKLYETQKEMNRPEIKLKKDVIRHWNSTYDMLLRILKNKEPLNSTVEALQLQSEFTLSESDWEIINSAIDILSIFNDFIVEISSEKTLSLSKTLILTKIMISSVKKSLQKPNMSKDIKKVGEDILNQISKWLSHMEANDLVAQATFLDPRFKNHGFLNDAAFSECKEKIIGIVESMDVIENGTNAISEIIPETTESSFLWADFDAKVSESQPSSAAVLEVEGYMSELLFPRTGNSLIWWKQRQSIYPRLYSLAQKRLFIPATSVPCERIFSKAGSIAMKKRNSLLPKNLSKLLFLNRNLD